MSSGLKRTGRRSEATPFAGGRLPQFATVRQLDLDAARYLAAVEAADGARLEPAVRAAVNTFVVGCKADGIWTPIKASCILAGARTLSGALVPLAGAAPTNNNFVSGDYSRSLGLVGNGSTKYLDSNRNHLSDPQNNMHLSTFIGGGVTGLYAMIGVTGGGNDNGRDSHLFTNTASNVFLGARNRHGGTAFSISGTTALSGFVGTARSNGSIYTVRHSSATASNNAASASSATSSNYYVFGRNSSNSLDLASAQRLAFYSIGESLDLALLDTRVTALITAIGAAIP